MVAVEIMLHHLHRLELLETCFFGNLVLALVGIMLEMAHVGDIADVAHLVAEMAQIAEEDVESDGGTGVSQMAVAVHRRAAHVHAYPLRMYGAEQFLAARQGVVDGQIILFYHFFRITTVECQNLSSRAAFMATLPARLFMRYPSGLCHERVGDAAVVGVAVVDGMFLGDFAESLFIFLHVVADSEEQIFHIFGSHDDTALHACLGSVGSHSDEVEVELTG